MVWPNLLTTNVDLAGDLLRNIPGIAVSQHLFDDLSPDPSDWDYAIAAEAAQRMATPAALITRPFDYGTVISYSFDASNWQQSRFSNARHYGVWYGSIDLETTVYETAWHWYQFVCDSYPEEDRQITSERRVFNLRCNALLVDLRGKEVAYPELVGRTSYAFTHQLGDYLYDQGTNGLLYRSARCSGVNAAIFRAERLSNVRDSTFLTYRLNVVQDTFTAERTPGTHWLTCAPSSLG